MKHEVFWKNPGYKPRPPLASGTSCKYLVVGGGVTGVSLAYFLARRGADVALIEKSRVGSGATGRAAGALSPYAEMELSQMIENLGTRAALIYYRSRLAGLHTMRRIIEKERIDCDHERVPVVMADSARRAEVVFNEYKIDKKFHVRTRNLAGKDLSGEINSHFFKVAVLRQQGLSFNPLKYVQNLSVRAEKTGARIYERTPLLRTAKGIAKTPPEE